MSEIGIKDQCFGVEVEMTGITPGGETPGDLRLFRRTFAQVHQVQTCLAAHAACAGGLGAG